MPTGYASFYGLPFPTMVAVRSWAEHPDRSRLREELRIPLTCLLYWMHNEGQRRPVARPGVISRTDRIISRQLWAYYSLYHRLLMLADSQRPILAGCYVCGTPTAQACPRCAAPHCRRCVRDDLACACVVLGIEHLRAHQIDTARYICGIVSGPAYCQPMRPATEALADMLGRDVSESVGSDESETSGGQSAHERTREVN